MSHGPEGFDSAAYWEQRYAAGRDSGPGSQGDLGEFKAAYLNRFVADHDIQSVVEFGCGDGRQLALADYPSYVGLDVAPTAITRCIDRFGSDQTKSFFLYSGEHFHDGAGVFRADLVLSVDVIYHLVEDDVFHRYLRHLFGASARYVIVYSNDEELPSPANHVRRRRFTDQINSSHWRLVERARNPHAYTGDDATGSLSDFFVYESRA